MSFDIRTLSFFVSYVSILLEINLMCLRYAMEDEHLEPILLTHYHVYQPLDEILSFVKKIIEKQTPSKFKLYLTAPLFSLEEFSKAFSQTSVIKGAEMMLSVDEGSFTSSV